MLRRFPVIGLPLRRRAAPLLLAGAALGLAGCNEQAVATAPDAGPAPGGLRPEQASAVVARVGERNITLGDFAAVLDRMNQYDRLRYQTKERRRELLEQLIDVELLAQEARRRGLDKDEMVQAAVRQILRDAVLAKTRANVPAPAEIPLADVRRYYDEHRAELSEPERRRGSAIVMSDKAQAEHVLGLALKITSGQDWGKLFEQHSGTAPGDASRGGPSVAPDLAGDLGIVGPPDDPKGGNDKVPDAVRRVLFELPEVGKIHDRLVEAEGKYYIVRLSGRTAGHTRSFEEAERAIRAVLLQQALREKEQALEAELRRRYPVQVDEAALKAVRLPAGIDEYRPYWETDGGAQQPGPDGGK
ncbi:MAG: peptidyl-prolyl cis-trans isomerase [Deltaproteobacteria bacterium]|nr:peptidyl-prolyl cis-trans isomerase [Deltaproteobacteria bacterium]